MREFLTRRVGPFPVWLWFLVAVLAGAAFIVWRRNRSSNNQANSTTTDSSALTQASAEMYPTSTDIFVNVPQPAQQPYNTGINPNGQPAPPPGSQPPIVVPGDPSNPQAPPRTSSITYAVRSGDTLYGIARRFGVAENNLYSVNSSTIEAVAKQHGYSSSDNGHWIFPGESLLIPVG